jgi:hypothetical protein
MNLKETNPDEFYRLMDLRQTDMNQFRKELRSTLHNKMKGKERYRSSKQCKEIIEKYKNASSDTEKEETKAELRNMLEKEFDKKQERRNRTIKKLSEKVEKLKQQLNDQTENKNQFINKQLEKMLNPEAGCKMQTDSGNN